INDAGTIVGNYQDQAGFFHSFLLSNGVPITFDVPQATETNALGINASGEIVGTYTDQANTFHGFLLRDGIYTTLDVPGATGTQAAAVNASGEIVGIYVVATGYVHGFARDRKGRCTTLDIRAGALQTVGGNNRSGEDVGH